MNEAPAVGRGFLFVGRLFCAIGQLEFIYFAACPIFVVLVNQKNKFMPISIRDHCIPASSELSRLRRIAPIPAELDSMEEKTAGGIVKKVWAVVNSDYFKSLPITKVIQSGADPNYTWKKQESETEMRRIYNECKDSI